MRILIFISILVWMVAAATAANHRFDNFKREIYSELLDDLDDSMRTIKDGEWHAEIDSQRREDEDDRADDYKEFFSEVLLKNDINTPEKINQREKRFLKSLLDLLKKNKTKPNPHKTDHDFFDSFGDEDDPNRHKSSTTTRYIPIYFSSTTKPRPIVSTPRGPSPLPSAAEEDPFYRLKNHCSLTFDQLCASKKAEIYDLVKKCDRLKIENSNQRMEPCRDVYSIYCYTFYDRFTCIGQDYDRYVPGRKKYTTSSARPTPVSTRATTGHTIKINVITTKPMVTTARPIVTTTTTRSTTTTTRPTTRAVITTTTKYTRPHVTSGGGGGGGAAGNPFPEGPAQIPKSAEKLKEIGEFCLKTKVKEPRCDTMLKLLKDKFKTCEKRPKTDTDCQTFKVHFCTAYTNFPCCPDVLAGRTCSGKSNSAAKRMMYM